jgi:hypothetical protein
MSKDSIIDGVFLARRSMEDLRALFENRLPIGCRLFIEVVSGIIEYGLSGVAFAGKRKGGLLGEGLVASGAFPSNDETAKNLNQQVAKNVERARASLVSSERVGQGMTAGTRRQITADLVSEHVLAIALDLCTGNRTWHEAFSHGIE